MNNVSTAQHYELSDNDKQTGEDASFIQSKFYYDDLHIHCMIERIYPGSSWQFKSYGALGNL